MARTAITKTAIDLQSDDGNLLWSFIRGEQLEFEVTLNFLEIALDTYTYEAVIMEALNVVGDPNVPDGVNPTGEKRTLVVRVPVQKGEWGAAVAYDREDVVSYGGLYYRLLAGTGRVDATTPDVDPFWEATLPNKVYIQFPGDLSITPAWDVVPSPSAPIYGFFELRVTEPAGGVYTRTWKPMRGVVSLQFSPTHLTP